MDALASPYAGSWLTPALATLRRRKWIIVQAVVVGALVATLVVLRQQQTSAAQVNWDIAVGAALGLTMGIALAFLREARDTNVRDVRRIDALLGLPLLGTVRAGRRRTDELALRDIQAGTEPDAYRALQASLDFANIDRNAHTFMVTGAVDGEGRTTTAANLAVALALSGRDVILADLDLRHPALAAAFSLEGRPGLTDVVLRHVDLDQALARVPLDEDAQEEGSVGELYVLPSGPPPVDPGLFVGTWALAKLVRGLASRADIVILDARPLLRVGDARTLAALADALILVTNLDLIRRPMVEELRGLLMNLPTRVIGYVATGASAHRQRAHRGYRRSRLRDPMREGVA